MRAYRGLDRRASMIRRDHASELSLPLFFDLYGVVLISRAAWCSRASRSDNCFIEKICSIFDVVTQARIKRSVQQYNKTTTARATGSEGMN